jgi:hypothetical protein
VSKRVAASKILIYLLQQQQQQQLSFGASCLSRVLRIRKQVAAEEKWGSESERREREGANFEGEIEKYGGDTRGFIPKRLN